MTYYPKSYTEIVEDAVRREPMLWGRFCDMCPLEVARPRTLPRLLRDCP